jgi:hypothetical protein
MTQNRQERCGQVFTESEDSACMEQVMLMSDIADAFIPFVRGIVFLKLKDTGKSDDDLEELAISETGYLVRFWLDRLEPFRCCGGGVFLPDLSENILPVGCEIDFDQLRSFDCLNFSEIIDVLTVVGTGDGRADAVSAALKYLALVPLQEADSRGHVD